MPELTDPKSQWPIFGVISSANPYFKVEGIAHNAYVDVPNGRIMQFLGILDEVSEKHGKDRQTLYEEASKARIEANQEFVHRYGGYLQIFIRREPSFRKPFGIQIRIDWDKLLAFLEMVSESEDIPLQTKYRYLSICRTQMTWMRQEPRSELMDRRVKYLSRQRIQELDTMLISFKERLREKRRRYRERLLIRRGIQPLLLAYFPEMILTFQVIRNCLSEGAMPTCYREMRKILENLSWVIVDDILLFRKRDEDYYRRLNFTSPLRLANEEWFRWAKNNDLIAGSLNKSLRTARVTEMIGERYGAKRRTIEDALFGNMTYPLFLALVGEDAKVPNRLKDSVPFYETRTLKLIAKRAVERTLSTLTGKTLSNSDEEFAGQLMSSILNNKTTVIIPYPSNSFIIQLLKRISALNLHGPYDRYSYFVHSYSEAWQCYPFSSILEFGILKHEMAQFTGLVGHLLDFYDKEMLGK